MKEPYPTFTPKVGDQYRCKSSGCLRYRRGDIMRVAEVVSGYIIPSDNPNLRLLPTSRIWKKA